jgi:hypothetical protein
MAWKSDSFKRSDVSPNIKEKVTATVAKHKSAMGAVVQRARQLSQERKDALDKIRDPELRKSAVK